MLSVPGSMSPWVRPPAQPTQVSIPGVGVLPPRAPPILPGPKPLAEPHPSGLSSRISDHSMTSSMDGAQPLVAGTELSIPGLEMLVAALPPRRSPSPAPAKLGNQESMDAATASLFGFADSGGLPMKAEPVQQAAAPQQSSGDGQQDRQQSLPDDFWTRSQSAAIAAVQSTESQPSSLPRRSSTPQLMPQEQPMSKSTPPVIAGLQSVTSPASTAAWSSSINDSASSHI